MIEERHKDEYIHSLIFQFDDYYIHYIISTLGQSKAATFGIEYWGLRAAGRPGPLLEPPPMFKVFKENQFFVFFEALKNFYEPPKPYLALETSLLLGSYL